jgi:hypothetical protein
VLCATNNEIMSKKEKGKKEKKSTMKEKTEI